MTTQRTVFSALIILFLFSGCSIIHKVFRKQEPPAPQKQACLCGARRQVVRKPIPKQQLNTGGPPAKIIKHHHTYVYEAVHAAGTQQFVITDMPVFVKPPERAVRLRLRRPPAVTSESIPMHKPVLAAKSKKGNAITKATQKDIKTVTVLFRLNSSAISPDASRKLRRFVTYYIGLLKDNRKVGTQHSRLGTQHSRLGTHDLVVDVTGYTCWLGSKKYNQSLALKRAKAVASRLRKAGVTIRSVTGKGKCCYIDRKDPAPNRRADVTVSSVSEGILHH